MNPQFLVVVPTVDDHAANRPPGTSLISRAPLNYLNSWGYRQIGLSSCNAINDTKNRIREIFVRSAEGGQGGMRRRPRGATSLGCWRIKWVDWSRRKETPRAACLVDRSMLVICEVTTNNVKPFAPLPASRAQRFSPQWEDACHSGGGTTIHDAAEGRRCTSGRSRDS